LIKKPFCFYGIHAVYVSLSKSKPMKKLVTLNITQPCTEKWDTFMPTHKGGYCSSCNKIVVDFTKMSDHEILAYFTEQPSGTCGRFRQGQLKNYAYELSPLSIHPGLSLLKAGLVSLLLMVISKPTWSQPVLSIAKQEVAAYQTERIVPNDTTATLMTVRGIVRDETHGPMPGVNVVLIGSTRGTVTDNSGRFELSASMKAGDVLHFSFIGYESQKYKLPKDFSGELEIPMITLDPEIMGSVAVVEYYEPKNTFLGRLWSNIKDVF